MQLSAAVKHGGEHTEMVREAKSACSREKQHHVVTALQFAAHSEAAGGGGEAVFLALKG